MRPPPIVLVDGLILMQLPRLLLTLLVLTTATLSAGCGGDGKYPVSGTVTWNGEPIPNGHIIFTPDDAAIAPDAMQFTDGSFSFRASPGTKRVEIFADRPLGEPDPIMNVVAHEQYIPTRYNEETELAANVTAEGPNQFQFDLVSQEGDQRAGMGDP